MKRVPYIIGDEKPLADGRGEHSLKDVLPETFATNLGRQNIFSVRDLLNYKPDQWLALCTIENAQSAILAALEEIGIYSQERYETLRSSMPPAGSRDGVFVSWGRDGNGNPIWTRVHSKKTSK